MSVLRNVFIQSVTFSESPGNELLALPAHCTITFTCDRRLRYKHHIVGVPGTSCRPAGFPQPALRRIAPHSATEFFACNKSNTTGLVVSFFSLSRKQRHTGAAKALALSKQGRNLSAGLDRFQHGPWLRSQALTSLGTTCRNNRAATLRGHACAEAMNLCAVARVRLIRALHRVTSFLVHPFHEGNFGIIWTRMGYVKEKHGCFTTKITCRPRSQGITFPPRPIAFSRRVPRFPGKVPFLVKYACFPLRPRWKMLITLAPLSCDLGEGW